jgi:hypothetical protein
MLDFKRIKSFLTINVVDISMILYSFNLDKRLCVVSKMMAVSASQNGKYFLSVDQFICNSCIEM